MKAKIIILMILVVLFTIFVSQNTTPILVNIYFWQVEMSVVILMSLSGMTGLILGFILLKVMEHKERKHTEDSKSSAEVVRDTDDKM